MTIDEIKAYIESKIEYLNEEIDFPGLAESYIERDSYADALRMLNDGNGK